MNVSSIRLSLIIVTTIFLASCATTVVYTDMAKGTDFTKYETYAWLPTPDSNNTLYKNDIAENNMRMAVNRELQKRGYRIDTANPDFLVLTRLMYEEEEKIVRNPVYSSYTYYYPGFEPAGWYNQYYPGYNRVQEITGYTIQEVEYTEGTIIIDVIDNSKKEENQLVWRGWTDNRVDPADYTTKLSTDVEEIFEEFPVPPQGKTSE